MPRMVSSTGRGQLRAGPSPASSDQFLTDNFSGPTVLLSTTKERRAYSGNCLTLVRSDGSGSTNIGFVGKQIDSVAADAYLLGGTAFVSTWYDQSGNANDAVQSTNTRRPQFLKDVDGKYTVDWQANGKGFEIADSATYKTAKVHCFLVMCGDNSEGGSQTEFIVGYTPTGTGIDVARWGLGWVYGNLGGPNGLDSAMLHVSRNASADNVISGQAHRRASTDDFVVWDFSPQTKEFRLDDGHVINDPVANSDITYPTSQILMVGNNRAYTNSYRGRLRAVIIYGTQRTDRDAISAYLNSAASHALPGMPWTFAHDGFTWVPKFYGSFEAGSADELGFTWKEGQFGGYDWSYAKALTGNGVPLRRYGVHQFDTNVVVDDRERSEITSPQSFTIAQGDTITRFTQFKVESGVGTTPGATGSWCLIDQTHYGDLTSTPDMGLIDLRDDAAHFVSQRAAGDTDTSLGTITRDVWYAAIEEYTWSASGTADGRKLWFGLNGTTLTQVANQSGAAIFDQAEIEAYIKQGIYRGDNGETAAPYYVQTTNDRYIKNSPGAYAAFITTQPALPTPA